MTGDHLMNTEAGLFSPRTGTGWQDPYGMYKNLREQAPVYRVPDNGEGEDYYVFSRHADVFEASVNGDVYTSTKGITHSYKDMELHAGRDIPIVNMDGPEHLEIRRVSLERFKPAKLAAIEPLMREFVVQQLDQIIEEGGGDIIQAVCKPLPSFFVALSLGVPLSDRALFDGWAWKVASASASGDVMAASDAVMEMVAYFGKMIADRRANPRDDMISALVHAELADGGGFSDAKIFGMGFTMVLGGNDTSAGLLSSALEYLTRYPDQRRKLADDPALRKNAATEALRLSTPVQGLARTVTKDVEHHGVTIPVGRKVLLLYASANREELVFGADAEDFEITRKIRQHMAFSAGAHMCIGAAAARMQAEIFLEEIMQKCPDFVVDYKAGTFAEGHFVRRYDTLPFEVTGFS